MRPAGRTGAGDSWATPWDVFSAIDRFYGPFDLDAAATDQNALCPAWWTTEDDGLAQPWKGRVWVNPPYSQTGKWTAKSLLIKGQGPVLAVIGICPPAAIRGCPEAVSLIAECGC